VAGIPVGLLARPARPRLDRELDATLDPATRLTLVSAPPGYGKSVAVAHWVAAGGAPAAWLTLSDAHDDPARLAADLLSALDGARPGSGALAALIAPGALAGPAALARLIGEAVEADDRDTVIVLDDVHAVTSPDGRALVRSLARDLPPFARLVLVTREDPVVPLGRLRAHGALVELRGDDLRFTRDEAAAFLRDAGVEAEPAIVDRLLGRTEGWPAALQLAAISLRASADAGAAAAAFSGTQRFVIDYLADEVLASLDAELRDFLVRLSVADRFDSALAGALTGRDDAAQLLARAERSNLFVVPLDADGRWYRLHGLFADCLRAELGPDHLAELRRIAAAWLEDTGLPREAISMALAAGDAERAARLMVSEGRVAFEAGELGTISGWLDALPPGVVDADGELVALDTWLAFYAGRLADAGSTAAHHLASTQARGPAEGRLLVLLAMLGSTTRADAEATAREGVALLGSDPLFRSLGLQAAGLAQLSRGDAAAALATLRAAFAEAEAVGSPMAVLPAVNPLGHALEATGRRDEAEAVARRVLAAFPGPSDRPPSIAWSARLVLGIALYEGGRVGEARRELELGLAAASRLGVGGPVLAWAVPHLALARQATGDPEGALAILRPAPGERAAAGLVLPSLADETEARIRLAQGDLAWAARWAADARPDAPAGSPILGLLRLSADLTVARVRLAEGRAGEALALLGPAREAYEAQGAVPELITVHVLQAAARLVTGERDRAVDDLGHAVRLASPGGYVRRFVDDGTSLASLLPLVRGLAPAIVAAVEAAIATAHGHGSGSRPAGPGRGTTVGLGADGELVESLTSRELEVLRVLATGATNADLAARLGVSPGTAKWHVAHILAKLGTRSRTGAVVRAQRLGLI
jgi:LuxR family maltose regulon positive regulatory protein